MFDETTSTFKTQGDVVLELEHSLVSVSKWESVFEKPFLGDSDKTPEEIYFYIKSMVLTPEVPEEVFHRLTEENIEAINTYINARRSATWFSNDGPKGREVITSELIYYWLSALNLPFSCETWHLNRLLTLIRIADLKSSRPRKMSRSEAAQRQRQLNEQRKAQFKTRG